MSENHGVMARTRLSDEECALVLELAEVCNRHDGLDIKLNPGMLQRRSGEHTDDFVLYAAGKLVGFLGLYQFKQSEIEASGMVHPDYRRRGGFGALYQAARQSCVERSIPAILWINERRSAAGAAFVQALGATYQSSEYVMELEPTAVPAPPADLISLRPIGPDDTQFASELMSNGFGMDPADTQKIVAGELAQANPKRQLWIASHAELPISVIGTQASAAGADIFGFVVAAEQRGQGYGRSILLKTVHYLRDLQQQPIVLEVATENVKALGLYESCGFRQTSANDYYTLPLVVAAS